MTSRRRWVIASVLLLGALPLLVWGAFVASHRAAVAEFRSAVAELRASGERTWLTEFYEDEIPRADNGAVALMAALRTLHVDAGLETSWPVGPWHMDWPERGDLSEEDRATLRAFVAAHGQFYADVDAALGRPRFRFPLSVDADGWPGGVDLVPVVQVLHLLQARAVSAPTQAERLDSAAVLLRLADRWERVSMLDHAMAATMRKTACAELRRELAQGIEDPVAARALLDPLLGADTLDGFPDCVRGERAFSLSACRALIDPEGHDEQDGTMFHSLRAEVASSGDLVVVGRLARDAADHMRVLQALLAVPTSDHRTYQREVVATYRRMRGENSWIEENLLPQLANAMFSVYPFQLQSFADVDAEQRLARLALAAACARTESAAWPGSAEDLARFFPEGVPTDPYTGAALRCAESGAELVLSSPGATVGEPWEGDEDEQPHNLLWRVAPPRSAAAPNDDR